MSHIWRGYGSVIFIELGELWPRSRRDGSEGNQVGEWTFMTESWRIEGKRLVWCGSSSSDEVWPKMFNRLQDARVASISLVGRLPEIDVEFANGMHVVSAMTNSGDPDWGLIRRRDGIVACVGVRSGRLHFEERPERSARLR